MLMDNIQYFDEMSIIEPDKKRRITMCNDLSEKIFLEFSNYAKRKEKDKSVGLEKHIVMIIFLWLLSNEIISETEYLKFQKEIDLFLEDIYVSKMNDHRISSSTRNCLEKLKEEAQYIAQNTDEEKKYTLSKTRADVIARNETNRFVNIQNHEIAKSMGYKFHIWQTMEDRYVRDTHENTNKQKKPIDEPFEVNGYLMMHPMDADFGAPIEEIIGCRCTETFSRK